VARRRALSLHTGRASVRAMRRNDERRRSASFTEEKLSADRQNADKLRVFLTRFCDRFVDYKRFNIKICPFGRGIFLFIYFLPE
jgi:hypothetical protein